MTINFPAAFPDFMDILGIEKVTWDIEEYKEYDMQGSGHEIGVKLAPSKWKAALVMRELYNDAARRIAAVVRKADGRAFMIYDPSNPYPAADPGGAIITGGIFNVQVRALASDGGQISLKGLPPGYKLTAGDKGQIIFASGAANYFFEFSEDRIADSGGIILTPMDVWPPAPIGVNVDAVINLVKPACKMKPARSGFAPGQSSGNMTFGTSVTMLEVIND